MTDLFFPLMDVRASVVASLSRWVTASRPYCGGPVDCVRLGHSGRISCWHDGLFECRIASPWLGQTEASHCELCKSLHLREKPVTPGLHRSRLIIRCSKPGITPQFAIHVSCRRDRWACSLRCRLDILNIVYILYMVCGLFMNTAVLKSNSSQSQKIF